MRELPQPALYPHGRFEIVAEATKANIGSVTRDLGAAAVRAMGFSALGSRTVNSLSQRVMRSAESAGLAVEPRPMIKNKFGGIRRLSFRAVGTVGQVAVLGAASGERGNFNEAYDKARGIFDGLEVPQRQRLAITDRGAKVEPWHREGLQGICLLKNEDDLDTSTWRDLAA